MTEPDTPVLISALQHAVFCMRQAALIHVERLWEENRFTAEGKEQFCEQFCAWANCRHRNHLALLFPAPFLFFLRQNSVEVGRSFEKQEHYQTL